MSTAAMTPSTLGHAAGPAIPQDYIWRLSVSQYHDMIRSGVLTADDPVELLEGWLVYKMPKNPLHRLITEAIREALERLVPAAWHVNVQEPITTDDSEPEPDVSVVRGKRNDYRTRHPQPADLGLVVEVSDTTLERDRGWKKKVYAQTGIVVYWVVNLVEHTIEVHSQPGRRGEDADYQTKHVYTWDQEVPVNLDHVHVGTIVLNQLLNR